MGATIRITEGRPTVAAGGSEWPFTVDLRNGTASVEIDGQAWHVRPQRWIEKRRLARFAHYGEEFVRGQLWTMCVEPGEPRRSATEAEALLAVAAWLSGGGHVQQALPLDSALLTRVTVAACRELGVAPHALDDLAPYEVESLWRGGRESAEVTRQPVEEPYQPSDGASEFTHRILIVPDDADALPPEGESHQEIGDSRFVIRDSAADQHHDIHDSRFVIRDSAADQHHDIHDSRFVIRDSAADQHHDIHDSRFVIRDSSHDDESTMANHEPPITNHESQLTNEPSLPVSAGRTDRPIASVAPEDRANVEIRDLRFMNRESVSHPESITNTEPPVANREPLATNGERPITNHTSRIGQLGTGDSKMRVRPPRPPRGNLPPSRFRVVSGVLPAATAIPVAASIAEADAPGADVQPQAGWPAPFVPGASPNLAAADPKRKGRPPRTPAPVVVAAVADAAGAAPPFAPPAAVADPMPRLPSFQDFADEFSDRLQAAASELGLLQER